jgi:hypothetical protein
VIDCGHKPPPGPCVQCLRDRLNAALEVLRDVEWSGDFCDDPACPVCLGRSFRGHAPDCRLARILGGQ